MRLARSFYLDPDVTAVARTLLGKVLVTTFDGLRTAGIITETEAYAGVKDRASHAFGDRHTKRTAPMYDTGGTAYVYLCYGIHHLFNVVTHRAGVPHAVLVRALLPTEGVEHMRRRRAPSPLTTGGPGTLAQALGIRVAYSGSCLVTGAIAIEDHGITVQDDAIIAGPRIGVQYAGTDALLPYRFRVAPSHPLHGEHPSLPMRTYI
jgi:DNA-3-methyladenine glycosylase